MATRKEPWCGDATYLNSWLEQLEEAFILEDLVGEDNDRKRVASLLTYVGRYGYEILKNLFSPAKPNTKKYDELTKALRDHVNPKPVVMVERHRFAQQTQGSKTVTVFLTDLRAAAEHCEFGDFYEDALRDRFICGLADSSIRKALLSEEKTLSLKDAHAKALAREQAASNAKVVVGGESEANYVQQTTPKWGKKEQNNRHQKTTAQEAETICKFCKLKVRNSKCSENNCKTSCFLCGKVGHTKRFCFKNPRKSNSHNVEIDDSLNSNSHNVEIDDYLTSMNYIDTFLTSTVDSKPTINLFVNSHPVEMELDTGSQLTIISKSALQGCRNLGLRLSDRIIRVANGQLVDNIMQGSVEVSCSGCKYSNLTVHVVDQPFPSLLGRDWIRRLFGEDWLSKFDVQGTGSGINMVYDSSKCASQISSGKDPISEREPGDMTDFLSRVRGNSVFEDGVGLIKDFRANIQVKEGSMPVYRKSRTVAYALREKVDNDLRRQVREGLLENVEHSKYASPIVIVDKPDGAIRICGDYKATVNPQLDAKQYPLPTEEECFYPMRGGKKFTRLDIRQAYNQVELSEEAKDLLTLNTPLGLFRPTRLPFGVSTAMAIFQEKIDKALFGIPNTVCRVDDICITGRNDQEHRDNVTKVINRLEQAGYRCRLDKCEFYKDSVIYLGHKVSSQGISPVEDKVKTLKEAPYPENLSELVSFIGAINYYAKFIPNMSMIAEPLNRLRGSGVKWSFGPEQKRAFDTLKQVLSSDKVLVQYNPDLPIKVDSDASKSGLGAVISHTYPDGSERPIEYASRSLNAAEKNYGQIEKEALSLVWAVKKFHRYIFARKFELVTDHKPLKFLLGENKQIPEMGVSRIQRWGVLLASYQYTLKFRTTSNHCNADVCSRFYLRTQDVTGLTDPDIVDLAGYQVSDIFLTSFDDKPTINHRQISTCTKTDKILSRVVRYVQEGWSHDGIPDLQSYYQRKDELSVERGCLLWGARVVVPTKLRDNVLNMLHACHPGIVSMKALSRSYVWWPGINEDIEKLSKHCDTCQMNHNNPQKTTPHPWIPATRAWERIHIDFAQLFDRQWLVVVDSYSKFPEIIDMGHNTKTEATIRELRKLFAVYGLPRLVVSDRGPQLVSNEMEDFLESNGIDHVSVPPATPYCNGLAERMVQTFKKALKKMQATDSDYNKNLAAWLLTYRNTPHSVSKQCPSALMFGRLTRTRLSLLYPCKPLYPKQEQEVVEQGLFREFKVGEPVYYKDVRKQSWHIGTVQARQGSKVYRILGENGVVDKHVDQLKVRHTIQPAVPSTPLAIESESLPSPPVPCPSLPEVGHDEHVVEHPVAEPSPVSSNDRAPNTTRSGRISKPPSDKWNYSKLGG